jgi:hypothetical protein
MKPTKLATFVALSLFGVAAGAQTIEKSTTTRSTDPVTGAQTTTQTTTRTEFKSLDTNADGYLVVSEVPSQDPFARVFAAYDADGNKKVTRVEYDAWVAAKPVAATTTTTTTTTTRHPAFAALDRDADGYIVVDEIPADNEFKTVWVKYDADGDKRITKVEYDPYYTVSVDVD